jgi:hypothetical protein
MIMQTLAIIITLLTIALAGEHRMTLNEAETARHSQKLAEHDALIQKLVDTEIQLDKNETRILTLIDDHLRTGK